MTQMLLFDFPTTANTPVTSPVPVTSRLAAPRFSPRPSKASPRREPTPETSRATPPFSGSLPLYDPAQGELHRIGDLAQLVLARYEIVHRRRRARLRRAQVAPSLT